MTNEEAIKYIRFCMCEGRLVGNTKPIIDEKWQAGLMAIKALERQDGAWKKDGYYLECSCCGYKIEADDLEMNNYCSACGAKMT